MTVRTIGATAYDIVAYPSGVFPTTHPDHLAMIARLHGLDPPSIETARVLDIGGGDGMNLLAMAQTMPDARFVSIDLAAAPVARGQAIAAAAGLANVTVEVGDIVEAARTLDGPFDYVVSHGVCAWVPQPVRDALFALIGRVLAPDGVAFVSYNALPGASLRRIVRDMVLHELDDIADARERGVAAQVFLKAFAVPRDGDPPAILAMRSVAERMSVKDIGELFHDELTEHYEPQTFADVVAAGAVHGLRFLNDAEPGQIGSGLPDDALDEPALIRAVQGADYAAMRLFHKTLFVRDTQMPARTPALDRVRDLYMSAQGERTGPTTFASSSATVTISDARLADAVGAAAAAWPARVRVGDLIDDDLRLDALYRLFRGEAIGLHVRPFGGTTIPGSHPRASDLARVLVALGDQRIFTLDHRAILLDDAAPRAFLSLLDGTRDRTALATDWAASGFADVVGVDHALARFGSFALMLA